jgi:oxygen-dependent protoporphyrinogen oxidase
MRRVAVIGGGITGLAAAHALDRAVAQGGLDGAVLLEAGPRLGGRVLTERVGGFLIEGGPDSFITLKPQAVQFAHELGLRDRLVGTLEPRHVFIRHGGRLLPLPDGLTGLIPQRLEPFVRSPLFSLGEKARFGLEPFIRPAINGADESLGGFVRRRLGDAAVDRLAAPLLAGIHAGDVNRLSLRATFPQLADAERRYGSLTRAVLARRRAGRRRAGEAPEGDATGGPLPAFMTVRGGLQELIVRAASSLRHVTVRTRTAVEGLRRRSGGYVLDLAGGEELEADAVILAVPAEAAAELLMEVNGPAAAAAGSIRSVSTAVIALGFRRDHVRHSLSGHGYVGSHREPSAHTACTWVSSKWPDRAPEGMALLRCFVGRDGAQDALAMDDGDLTAAVIAELRPLLGITGMPVLTRVYRWRDAMPQYEVGHLDRLAAMEAALAATPGLVTAGAPYRGVGLPDCIAQGMRAARHAVDALRVVQPGPRQP